MSQKPISSSDLAAEIQDLKLRNLALMAVVASLPGAGGIDPEQPHELLEKALIDPKLDVVGNDQIARAMHFVQATLELARRSGSR